MYLASREETTDDVEDKREINDVDNQTEDTAKEPGEHIDGKGNDTKGEDETDGDEKNDEDFYKYAFIFVITALPCIT